MRSLAQSSHSFWQLFLLWLRPVLRERSSLFFSFVFPLLVASVLGMAFRDRGASELSVLVAEGPEAEELAARLDRSPELRAKIAPLDRAREELRRGRAVLVLVSDSSREVLLDPSRPDSRTARLAVARELTPEASRQELRVTETNEPGSRYIDFLIPGLMGYSLLNAGIWGICMVIVRMRAGRMLKRLAASPMSRFQFLLAFVLGRSAFSLLEISWLLLFARVVFDVPLVGNLLVLLLLGLLGAISFTGLSLLVGSRTSSPDVALGVGNLVMLPMMVLSGVFFPSSSFPDLLQPLIAVLPLTALNEGLRTVMLDGGGFGDISRQVLILATWGLGGFTVGTRLFRWQ
ncbi:ABC transporter permease [Archangium sp.]|jgi:ABC-type multidrug transport system permease subunit|uniref:ABC transporter permease n=1 Tax=Archangium sp. TaxID=1872627 RepID=UPI002ED9B909